MAKKQLSEKCRKDIIDMIDSNILKSDIARHYKVDPKTIYNIYSANKHQRKPYDNQNRFKLKEQDKIDILELLKNDSSIKLNDIRSQLSTKVSPDTINRFIKSQGYKTYVALKKRNITRTQKKERVRFAMEHIKWIEEWKNVIFTDESTINTEPSKVFIRSTKEDRFNVQHYNKYSKTNISVNIYGLINFYESKIFNVSKSFDRTEMFTLLYDKGVLDYMKYFIPGPDIHFQQDNLKVHHTAEVLNLLTVKGFKLFEWPAYSPDMNPIERIWAILKKNVSSQLRIKQDQIKDEASLFALCEECFQNIGQQTIRNVILQQPVVLNEAIRLNGEMTKF